MDITQLKAEAQERARENEFTMVTLLEWYTLMFEIDEDPMSHEPEIRQAAEELVGTL